MLQFSRLGGLEAWLRGLEAWRLVLKGWLGEGFRSTMLKACVGISHARRSERSADIGLWLI